MISLIHDSVRQWRVLLGLAVLVLLSACGGGGSDSNNQPPTAFMGFGGAVVVGHTVTLDGTGSRDPEGRPLTYLWTLVARPAGSSAALQNPTTDRPTLLPDVPGEYRVELVVSDGALASNVAAATLYAVIPTIVLSQEEPLRADAVMRLEPAMPFEVEWSVNSVRIAVTPEHDNSVVAPGPSPGVYQVTARIRLEGDDFFEVSRTVLVGIYPDPDSLRTIRLGGSQSPYETGEIAVSVHWTLGATQDVASMSGRIDSIDLGTLTAPNACDKLGTFQCDWARFSFDSTQLASGIYLMEIDIVVAGGATMRLQIPLAIRHP